MSDASTNPMAPRADRLAAAQLNRECFCVALDQAALSEALRAASGDAAFAELVSQRPHLYSHAPVFLPKSDAGAMQAIVAALEATARLPGYQAAIMSWAPEIATHDFGPRGAFMGYDFHLGDDGPKLIEINTNAGGAFFNAFLAGAQVACCAEVERALAHETLAAFEPAVIAMFEAEWGTQRPSEPLRTIAIVDDDPEQQYLYPEFILAKTLLARHGYDALVVDAGELRYEQGVLQAEGRQIDLVYNRLVDFALAAPDHAALRAAYLDGAVVLTPNPRNHALHADKRNLTLLSDQATMRGWGVSEEHLRLLKRMPNSRRVTSDKASELWSERKHYFFKPASGHGGKAVYRGDKLTKTAWETVLSGDYIAQDFAAPSERTILLGGERVQRKLDVRLYTYAGEALLAVARLYQGQTTNFRTPGGGFAPVFFV
jgi:glutathione synthase/RimK-type ligase-like ATP-grasp enzyme